LYATYAEIITKTVDMREDAGGRPIQKAKVHFELAPLYAVIYIGIFVNPNQRNGDYSNVYQK
jgi:hypothetical protein